MKARLTTRRWAGSLVAVAIALASSIGTAAPAHADVVCGSYSSSTSQCVNSQLTVGGTSWNVDWYLPNGTATALMTLQHGYSRGCGNLRNTSKAIAEKGVMVLCLNAPMSGGNPDLGNALGDLLASRNVTPPLGKPLPLNYVVGGHSAGGHFATVVGARLAADGYPYLKGAVLFDAVASDGFSANLQAISAGNTRPVLEVAARPSTINLYNNSFGGLKDLPSTYVGIQLVWAGYYWGSPYGGSCHTDVEGENGDWVGNYAAGCTPDSTNVARLRDFGSNWAADLATGAHTSAYYCTDERDLSTCGSKVRDLVARSLPLAATIPAS